ncbi:GPO family capsid scaffolding protein, partial [Paraburkholderia sp. SIMBA_049]
GVAPMTGGEASASPFGSYGDVIALTAEEIADGPLKGKLALYAQVAPTQALIDLVKARQKVYSSIEINPSFADTKQAYLIGL